MSSKLFVTIFMVGAVMALLTGCQAVEKSLRALGHDKQADVVKATATAGAAITPFSVDEEIEIGRAMAARIIETSGGVYPDKKLNRYVNLVGRAVALNVSRSDLDADLYQFAVVNSDEINAIAMPGGYVLITLGALRIIENEAELAGVLAHEITHIDEGHLISAIKTSYGIKFLSQMADLYNKNDNRKLNKMLSTSSDCGISILYQKGLSRSAEKEADQNAVKLSAKRGYHPAALKGFLNRLKEESKENGSFLKTLTATHPDTSTRIKTIKKYLAKKKLAKVRGAQLTERYKIALQGIK